MTGGDHRSFVTRLDALKTDGCSLLVSGDVSSYAGHAATRRLMGAPTESRRRVLVLGGDVPAGHCLPGGVAPTDDHVAVVDDGPDTADPTDVAADVSDAVTALEPDAGYDPGQLRVGVVTTDRGGDVDVVARTARSVGDRVRDANGMGHCRLHVASDDAHAVAGGFDAHLELRETPHVQQRWHLDEPTRWFDL
ncbi:DUF7504 family protein [Halocalculus aciditolerans]|uniref:Uncharacterized protein n=1 Tax=Halocalculus aciditolerans TaxID=1383812 RepID=A0A830F9F1_9EURY|nr:hypothetical protein [Halocalculus aciditolerans]GGL52728.1 hypothetical protein GCM10009039_08710 [Halocalculus aciditolerans]